MTTFDSRQLPLPLNPGLSHPSICTPTDRIPHHLRHNTWRLFHSLLNLLSNPQGQTRRLLLHVSLKTPYAPTPHFLDHWKPTTKETNPGLQIPPRNSQRERSVL
jgi:hypothetical protein